MHLHISRAEAQRNFESGANMKKMADSNQPRQGVGGRKAILQSEHEQSTRCKYSYKFLQVTFRKVPRYLLQNDIAVNECETPVGEGQLITVVRHVPAVSITCLGR
jgi:hypothetical protein